jgi:DNA-binding GntR family transcriptional regulator
MPASAGPRQGETQLRRATRSSARTLAEAVFLELRDAVLAGKLRPGSYLRLQQMAAMMQVSMQPVREAFRRLEALGLVEVLPHRGARVMPLILDDLRDSYEARLVLEPFAVRKAAARFTNVDAQRARKYLDDHVRLTRAGHVDDARTAHTSFHFTLYEAAGSLWLLRSIEPLWANCERYRLASLPARGSVEQRRREHQAILDACIRHDPALAELLLSRHLSLTANLVARAMGSPDLFELTDEVGH